MWCVSQGRSRSLQDGETTRQTTFSPVPMESGSWNLFTRISGRHDPPESSVDEIYAGLPIDKPLAPPLVMLVPGLREVLLAWTYFRATSGRCDPFLSSGRRAAAQPAMIPKLGSRTVQMATSLEGSSAPFQRRSSRGRTLDSHAIDEEVCRTLYSLKRRYPSDQA